jgi:hypothetical protein
MTLFACDRVGIFRLFLLLNKGGVSLAACKHRSYPEDGSSIFLRIGDTILHSVIIEQTRKCITEQVGPAVTT